MFPVMKNFAVLAFVLLVQLKAVVFARPEQPYTGGVVTNGHGCAKIGASMLARGGSAVDAVIASMLCEGVTMPHNMGIGGGFIMNIYIRETKTSVTLVAKERAPQQSSENMFKANQSIATKGGLSVAVPGEVRGYWAAHQRYGKLPWAEVIKPSIELCKTGHLVTPYLDYIFNKLEKLIRMSPGISETFINPATNKTYKEGEFLKRPKLAKTLEAIARDGPDALYDGILTKDFVKDIQDYGGIITAEDMRAYRPTWEKSIQAQLPFNQTLYTAPLPASGIISYFILNILNGIIDTKYMDSLKNWQRIIEGFKFGYAKRAELGDPWFAEGLQELIQNLTSAEYAKTVRAQITDDITFDDPRHYGARVSMVEDHGTAHFAVLAPNGDAVSVTSTTDLYFGAGFLSKSTGIILNDQMDDFSSPNLNNHFGVPPAPANYIVPGKRPASSMCPNIIVDENGDVILIIGSAGGLRIITSVVLVTMRYLWCHETLAKASAAARLHHQLFPMELRYERFFDKDIVEGLRKIGHRHQVMVNSDGFSTIIAIGRQNNFLEGSFDWRRQGQVCMVKPDCDDELDTKCT